MDWFRNWWYKDDPLKSMDPTLRDFLEKEAPKRYRPATSPSSDSGTYREELGLKGPAESNDNAHRKQASLPPSSGDKPLPAESLFKDGRYKDFWATYRPQAEVDEQGKSDQEKLADIVLAHKDRQIDIKRAAMDNCADEQFNLHDCFRNGGWSSRMTMCRAENKALNHCVMMQTRFLRALGFASLYDRTPEETEKIQMHADRLFKRLQEQEKQLQEARAKGEAAPKLAPLMEPDDEDASYPAPLRSQATGSMSLQGLPAHVREKLEKKKFDGLEGPELELARHELEEEVAYDRDVVRRFQERWAIERKERLDRLRNGEERFGDKIVKWFDVRKYPSEKDD